MSGSIHAVRALIAALALAGAGCAATLEDGSFRVDGRRFVIRGVAYPNAAVTPCAYARDLPLIARMGANTIRTYGLIPPDREKTFASLLETSGLYWLAGFPLDGFYDPSKPIAASKQRILESFRTYAQRFRGNSHLIAFVFGNDVPDDYQSKFAGSPEDFFDLLVDAGRVLRETGGPLLTTAVSDPSEMLGKVAGLDFWSWNAAGMAALAHPTGASAPVLVAEFGIATRDEQEQAAVAADLMPGIAGLGGVYAGFIDAGGMRGIFKATPSGEPDLDSLSPRRVYFTLAGLWGGTYPQGWSERRAPLLRSLAGGDAASPGSLVRLTGSALLDDSPAYDDESWPFGLAASCLCVGSVPARLNVLSRDSIVAQVPPGLEPGEHRVVFFRGGQASNVLPVTIRHVSAGSFPGASIEARKRGQPGVPCFSDGRLSGAGKK